MIIGKTLTDIYEQTMWRFAELKAMGENQASQFGDTIEILNYSCCLINPRARFVATKNRKHSLKYLIGEFIWYLSGEQTVERISHYSAFWNKLVSEYGLINSNYGYKIFKRLIDGKNQFNYVIDELKRDLNSRRAIMILNLIDEDYCLMHKTKDFPCTIFLQFLIRNEKLHMFTTMRSNDFILGFCNDVPFFTIIQEMLAVKLKVKLGYYYHNAISSHVYERNYSLLKFKPADYSDANKEIFPRITLEDFQYFDKLADYEFFIREFKDSWQQWIKYEKTLPPFTQFIIDNLINFWVK